MKLNILQEVQENLDFKPLQKMDANTQQVINGNNTSEEGRFSQAAIPAVIIAIYEFTQSDEGADKILHPGNVYNWIEIIFNNKASEAINKVSEYSHKSVKYSITKMNAIAHEAIFLINKNVGENGTLMDVKTLLASQRTDVLPYLPADMQIGSLLNDSTLDDRTNKMQGPVSSLMHLLGNEFSAPDVKDQS